MSIDANIQVWLDAQTNGGQTIVVPYVKTVADRQLGYRMEVLSKGGAGSSRISQGGNVHAFAAKATPLATVALTVKKTDDCRIDLVLTEAGTTVASRQFDCPRQAP
jgi:hypothetical protein